MHACTAVVLMAYRPEWGMWQGHVGRGRERRKVVSGRDGSARRLLSGAGGHTETAMRTLLANPPAVTVGDAQSCYRTYALRFNIPPFVLTRLGASRDKGSSFADKTRRFDRLRFVGRCERLSSCVASLGHCWLRSVLLSEP